MEKDTLPELLGILEYQLESIIFYNGSQRTTEDALYTFFLIEENDDLQILNPVQRRELLQFLRMAIKISSDRAVRSCGDSGANEPTPTDMIGRAAAGILTHQNHSGEPGCSEWTWWPHMQKRIEDLRAKMRS